MKRYISGLFISLLFMGCSHLVDVTPENSTTFTSYFKTVKDAEALLVTLEASVREMILSQYNEPHTKAGLMVDSTQDNSIRSAKNLEPGDYTRVKWNKYYKVINSADMILDNLHRFPLHADTLKPYALQAYFAKGLTYFQLAQRWGEAPITKGTTYFGKLSKSSVHDVLEEATKWALKSMELPIHSELRDGNGKLRTCRQYGSKGSAAALLAHIYAWRAEIENMPEYWEEAEKYCSMIINKEVGLYELASDPEEICNSVLSGDHKENIWEIYRDFTTEEGSGQVAYFQEAFIAFPIKLSVNSSPAQQPILAINKKTVRQMYETGDRRRDAYFIWVDADSVFLYGREGKLVAGTERPAPGTYDNTMKLQAHSNQEIEFAFVYKFRNASFSLNKYTNQLMYQGQDINKVFWRLADIMLLRAECRARQNKPSASEDLDNIRERAFGNRTHSYTSAEGDIRLAIFREREKEFLFEGCSYFDMRRNGVDYLKREIGGYFNMLTDQDIKDGALYVAPDPSAFSNNDLMRQNVYWNKFLQ